VSKSRQTDSLDRLLAISFSSRPEPQAISNLAERSMERAQMLERLVDQRHRAFVLYHWQLRLVSGAAVLLIGFMILLGGNRLLRERSSMMGTGDSISTGESTASSAGTYVAWLGGLLFICTVAGIAAESAIGADGPTLV
jgi:hypothetical protein